MGLDMYLNRKLYVKNWDHMKPEELHTISVLKGGKPVAGIKPERISEITEQVAYWRKANAIHNWFVQTVQAGNDDCRDYYVSREQLAQLRDLCIQVLQQTELVPSKVHNGTTYSGGTVTEILEDGEAIANPTKAAELLPTASGFFFGSTGRPKRAQARHGVTRYLKRPQCKLDSISLNH
jgi:hypothetical protein